ncbi:MAG: AIR synthase-related protein [Actinomycetota bacterium]
MDAYKAAGVDYDVLDAAKRRALASARETTPLLAAHGGEGLDESRGEPAFVFRLGDQTLAVVLECLGTKSVVAREFAEAGGADHFADVGFDTVAAIVNDLCCVGALPVVVNAYFATGAADWYGRGERLGSLVQGWRAACEIAGATWGGGESPTLPSLVAAGDIELAGSAVGYVPTGIEPILGRDLAPGDRIVLIASSGLHANGASVVRRVAAGLPDGLRTGLPSSQSLGDAALTPSRIYVPLVAGLLGAGVTPTYLSHITGHGLRKVMRADRDLAYRLDVLPEVPEVLGYLAERAGMDAQAAYGTFNMGAGFAIFCRPDDAGRVTELAAATGFDALDAGEVEAGPRKVILTPVGVTFASDELSLR